MNQSGPAHDGAVQARPVPAAEEERHAERGERDQVDVLGHRVEPEAHPAVLGVVAGDELLLGLGEVERRAGGLGRAREQEDDQPDELRDRVPDVSSCAATISVSESVPAMITTPRTESASDTSYETSCAHVRIEPRSAYFESDDQPPRMNPYTPMRADREDQDQRDVEVGDLAGDVDAADLPARPERDHRERHERGERGEERAEDERPVDRLGRLEALLVQELQQVGDRLQQSRGSPRGSARSAAASGP